MLRTAARDGRRACSAIARRAVQARCDGPLPAGTRVRAIPDAAERARAMTEQEAVSGLFSATPLPMFVLDAAAGRVLAANEAALDRYGLEPAMVAGLDPVEPRARGAGAILPALGGGGRRLPHRGVRAADRRRRVVRGGAAGDPAALGRRGRAAAHRPRHDARVRNEERLRQAQKMEAIGRLAGSIAHDFNNLLTAIGGYADLLAGGLDPDDPAVDDAREIRRAVDRGAASPASSSPSRAASSSRPRSWTSTSPCTACGRCSSACSASTCG